jgi:hypothetical protein
VSPKWASLDVQVGWLTGELGQNQGEKSFQNFK